MIGLVEGATVRFKDGSTGVIVSAYWAHRDRYKVRHENGVLLDHCSEAMMVVQNND